MISRLSFIKKCLSASELDEEFMFDKLFTNKDGIEKILSLLEVLDVFGGMDISINEFKIMKDNTLQIVLDNTIEDISGNYELIYDKDIFNASIQDIENNIIINIQ